MEHLSSYLSSDEENNNHYNPYSTTHRPILKAFKHSSDKSHLHNHKKLRPYISLRKRNLSHDFQEFPPNKKVELQPTLPIIKSFESPAITMNTNHHHHLPSKTLYSIKVTKSMVTKVRWLGNTGEAFIYGDTFGKIGVIKSDKGTSLLQLNSPNGGFISDIQPDHCYDARVVTSSWSGDLIQWDLTTQQPITHLNINNSIQVTKPANPSSSVWLVGLKQGGFEAYDLRCHSDGPILKAVNSTPAPVMDLMPIPNSHHLVVGYNFVGRGGLNPCLQAFDLRNGVNLLHPIYNQPYPPTSMYHHPHLNKWYCQFQNDTIHTFKSTPPFQQSKLIKFQSGQITSGYHIELSGNSEGTLLGTGSADGKLYIYDINTTKLLKSWQPYRSLLLQTEFHPTRHHVVLTRGDNGWIKVLH